MYGLYIPPAFSQMHNLSFHDHAFSLKFRYHIQEADAKLLEGIFHCPQANSGEMVRVRP